MKAFDPVGIASAGVPVLCADTCSILDIMRDPVREQSMVKHRTSAIALLDLIEAGKLVCLVADQVAHEFGEHDAEVQAEAARTIKKLRECVDRVNEIHGAFDAPVGVNLSHLDAMVPASRLVVGRWLAASVQVTPTSAVLHRAWDRVNRNVSPSRRGKDSIKDCVVFETYLEAMAALRSAGLTTPAVFISSNWREYATDAKVLKPDLVADFAASQMSYADHALLAKIRLGV